MKLFLVLLLAPFAFAQAGEQLKPETVAGFEAYARDVESGLMKQFAAPGSILTLDRRPDSAEVYRKLKAGELVSDRITPREVPGGMLHHWRGAIFIPRTTLDRTLALLQDYDNHAKVYTPDVQASKLLSRDGDKFRAFLRFFKKKVISVVLNTEHAAEYKRLDPHRAYSISRATRVAEVKDPGTPKESEKPVGNDSGFLWRLNSYWRFHEKDGGVYVECEAITLTRRIPRGLGWLIGPFVTSVPKESLSATLEGTRRALVAPR